MRSKQVKWMAVALVVLLALVGFGWRYGREWVVTARATYLEGRAEEALRNGEWSTAARLGESAYYLGEGRPRAALLTARAHLRQRSPLTVDWWRRGLSHSGQPVEELRELVTLLLDGGAYEESLEFLNRLLLEDPDAWETRSLWMRVMASLRRYGEALSIGETLIGREGVDWSAQRRHIELRSGFLGPDGAEAAARYLKEVILHGGGSALEAARMLIQLETLSLEERIGAAIYLQSHGEGPLDALDARWVLERAGQASEGSTNEWYERWVMESEGEALTRAALASVRIGQPQWLLGAMEVSDYVERGGQVEVYFEAGLKAGQFAGVLDWAEALSGEALPGASPALISYYRAMGQRGLRLDSEAAESLRLAVEIAASSEVPGLEAKLYASGEWELLQALYSRLLKDSPGQASYRQKALTVAYTRADQAGLEALLEGLDMDDLAKFPVALSFAVYLRLLSNGWTLEDHERLESLVARYPETFDFRLLLGFSHLLEGETAFARGFIENMPLLDSGAPRFLRVCASLLAGSGERWLSPSERLELLPRERHLLAMFAARP